MRVQASSSEPPSSISSSSSSSSLASIFASSPWASDLVSLRLRRRQEPCAVALDDAEDPIGPSRHFAAPAPVSDPRLDVDSVPRGDARVGAKRAQRRRTRREASSGPVDGTGGVAVVVGGCVGGGVVFATIPEEVGEGFSVSFDDTGAEFAHALEGGEIVLERTHRRARRGLRR